MIIVKWDWCIKNVQYAIPLIRKTRNIDETKQR